MQLSSRREKQRLILFYKIINGLSPPHLSMLYANYLSNNQRYNFRTNNMQHVYARTETFKWSFFPSVIRSWNSLNQSLRDAETISQFKASLCKKHNKNVYFTYGSRCINSILASMRTHCSQLNSHLFDNNIICNNQCQCGVEETILHFFLECTNYTVHRDTLLNITIPITPLTVAIILNGDKNLSFTDNKRLHNAISSYIISTNRFNIF